MEGHTIRTLSEYIVKLRKDRSSLEHLEEYQDDEQDTNGVEQDHRESMWRVESR